MAMFSPQDKIKHIEEALRWLRMKTPMSMSAREAKDLQDEITRMEKELQDENMSLIAQQMVNDMMKAQMQAGQITPVTPNTMIWTCESCGKNSMDPDITVTSISLNWNGGARLGYNVKHCKDEVSCIAKARAKCEEFKENEERKQLIRGMPPF
jgi:hypothetical protein